LEVDNDRVCAEWLACRSGGVADLSGGPSASSGQAKTKPICYSVGLCNEAEPDQPSKCKNWVEPTGAEQPLTAEVYQARDTGWGGQEFSGYSVANTYPLASLKQMSVDGTGDSDSYKLVYDGGVNSPWIKTCAEDKNCNGNKDCSKETCYMKCEPAQGGVQKQCVGSKICRGYPAVDSPFPYLKKNDQDDGATNYCAKDYDSATTPDCDCGYQKVTYKESQDQYYNYNDTEIAPCGAKLEGPTKENPEQKCGKCDNNQNPCDGDSDCIDYKTEPETKGKCQFNDTVEKRQKFLGWRGYCLEWDEKTGSCLTWYPADYLTGDADMYNNFQEAGYNPGEDKYYCLEAAGNGLPSYIKNMTTQMEGVGCDGLFVEGEGGFCGKGDKTSFTPLQLTKFFNGSDCVWSASHCQYGNFPAASGDKYFVNEIEQIMLKVVARYNGKDWPAAGTVFTISANDDWKFHWLGPEGADNNAMGLRVNFGVDKRLSSYDVYVIDASGESGGVKVDAYFQLREPCLTIAQTASMDKNIALTDRLWENNSYKYSVAGLSYPYAQDYKPYGSAVTPYSSPETWDSIPGEEGNQPLYVEAPNNNQVRAGSPYACKSGATGCNGKRTCVGGKNAGDDCTTKGAKACQGGVCVGSDKAVSNVGVDAAIASIEEIFAKSMGVWKYETKTIIKYKCENTGISCAGSESSECGIIKYECGYACIAGENKGKSCSPKGDCKEGQTCEWLVLASKWRCVEGGVYLAQTCKSDCPQTAPISGKTYCENNRCIGGVKSGDYCGVDGCGNKPLACLSYEDNIYGYSASTTLWDVTWDLAGTKTTKIATKPPEISGMTVDLVKGNASLPVKLNFFAWADDNHMPIKTIRIDWGDKETLKVGSEQSYYKNHKAECTTRCESAGTPQDGLVCTNEGDPDKTKCRVICDLGTVCKEPDSTGCKCEVGVNSCIVYNNDHSCAITWEMAGTCRKQFGDTNEACIAKPFEFSHVYYCSAGGGTLEACSATVTYNCFDGTACVYKPKAQVVDNWGWCNGRCENEYNGGAGSPAVGCYEGIYEGGTTTGLKECSHPDVKNNDDSYTSYGGTVIVSP